MTSQKIRSIHVVECEVYEDKQPLWPPKDGDLFPFRIKISAPTYVGEIGKEEFVPNISFMRIVDVWSGTIQGASGVFNERLTREDVKFIKNHLRRMPALEIQAERAAEQPAIKNLFRLVGSDVLESLKRILPALGLAQDP